jgi:hypothetical protein
VKGAAIALPKKTKAPVVIRSCKLMYWTPPVNVNDIPVEASVKLNIDLSSDRRG